ncbi:glycosyltransferase family 9 protein [bacterium]|nr:glycosyltransferase family 9 protein [bacterium]
MIKVVAFHQNQLGDLLFSLPALKALRDQKAIISSVVRPYLAGLLKETSLIDEIIIRKKGANLFDRLRLISQIRQQRLEMGLFFSCSEGSLILGYLGGLKERIGFMGRGDFLLTGKIAKKGTSSTLNYLRLVEEVGIKPQKKDYVGLVKIPFSDMEFAKRLLKEEKIAVISPFASKRRKNKEWSEERWAKVLDFLWTKKHLKPLIVGTKEEIGQAEKIRELARVAKPQVLAGKTTILQLGALIKLSKIFIGIDSGPTHLASSLKVPVVALFGPTDPSCVGPEADNSLVIKKEEMGLIEAEEVVAKIEKIA